MGFLDKLGDLLSGQARDDAIHLYVRCDKCGAQVHVRADKQYDLQREYDGDAAYVLYKEMLDDKCFTLMRGEFRFDGQYNLLSADIQGGQLVTREEDETGETV
jgi:hypothetical protein